MSRRRPVVRLAVTLLAVTAVVVSGTVVAAPAFAAAPTITSFSPTSGILLTSVTLKGTGFTSPARVSFGGVAATIVKVTSSTSITTQVPAGAPTGKITLTVAGGTVTTSTSFTVNPGVRLSVTSGPPTSATTASFSGLTAYEAADVYLDTTAVGLVSVDRYGAGSSTVTLPAAATPGVHWVSVVGRTSGRSAQTSFTVRTDWNQLGFDGAQRSSNPYETALSTGTVQGLDEVWRSGPGGSAVTDGVAVVGGRAFANFRDYTARAFDARTGVQKWAIDTTASSSAFAVGPTLAYYAAGATLYALNPATGATVWSRTLPESFIQDPVLVGTTLYVLDDDHVTAWNALSGAPVWNLAFADGTDLRHLAVGNGWIVVGSYSGTVRGIDQATGTVQWTDDLSDFDSGLTIANGLAYVTSYDPFGSTTAVTALDVEDGSTAWTVTTNGEPSQPAYARGVLYLGTSTGVVYALTATTGALVWSTTLTGSPYISAQPTVANGVLYVPTRSGLRALAASYGGLVWSSPESSYYDDVVISDGSLYIATATSKIVRYALPNASDQGVQRPDVRTLHR